METARKEAGNDGRTNLGFRRLVVSHVENAGTLYAYKEEDKVAMAAVDKMAEQCKDMKRIHNVPQESRMYGVFHSGRWFRAEVEQIISKEGKKVRVRMVDYGWKDFVKASDLYQLPENLLEAKINCEKYKMAAMKPRGKYEGYSAADREKGKQWLEKTIDGRVVEAECHILASAPKHEGIQMEARVGDINLNKVALQSGHAILLKDRAKIIKEISEKGNNNQQERGFVKRDGEMTRKSNIPKKDINKRDEEMKRVQERRQSINENYSSCTEELKEIFQLLDQASQIRNSAADSSEKKDKDAIMKLIKIPETVVGAVDAMSPLLEGIEAVTAASKLLEEAKKEDEKDVHKVAVLKSTTILYKCTSKFLSQYSLKQEDINKIEEDVDKQVRGLPSTIPASWRLLTVKADRITKKNLLDLIKNVEKYLDESGAKQLELAAESEAEVSKLTDCLVKIGEGIQVKFEDRAGKEIPANINSIMKNVKSALQKEISETKQIKNVKENKEITESSAVGSAWRALTALKSQLELIKKKKIEFENIHKDLEADIYS